VLAGAGWVAAAVVATGIGMGGVRLIGDSLTSTPGGVLDQQDVAKALAASSPSAAAPAPPLSSLAPSPSPSAAPSSDISPIERGFSSAGGSMIAGCRAGRPYLRSWAPSPGYSVTQRETESEHVDVRFEGSAGRSEIRVACDGNTPVEQDHGGGRGK